jgi:hypothetical protein
VLTNGRLRNFSHGRFDALWKMDPAFNTDV